MKNENYKENVTHQERMLPIKLYTSSWKNQENNLCPHWHEEMEILQILEGNPEFLIDSQSYKTKPGDILLVPPRILHSGGTLLPCVYNAFVFNLEILNGGEVDSVYLNYVKPILQNQMRFKIHLKIEDESKNKVIEKLLISLSQDLRDKKRGYELLVKMNVFNIFYQLFTEEYIYENKNKNNQVTNEKVKELLNFIYKNYNKNLGVEKVAEKIGYNPQYFCRYFKEKIGKTYVNFLNSYRILKAGELLLNSTLSVTEIAYEVGFENLSYFNKVFKEIRGVSPTKYKKNSKKRDIY